MCENSDQEDWISSNAALSNKIYFLVADLFFFPFGGSVAVEL